MGKPHANKKQPRRIVPGSLRWRLAQRVLQMLYKRPQHYIAPWEHFGCAVSVLLFHNDKTLLGRRCLTENEGKLWFAGGHIDPSDKTIAAGAAREVFEETSMRLDESKLTLENLIFLKMFPEQVYIEMSRAGVIAMNFVYVLSDAEVAHLQDSDEMVDWRFYSEAETYALIAEGKLVSTRVRPTFERAFARARVLAAEGASQAKAQKDASA